MAPIIERKEGYSFEDALQKARKSSDYYQEKLLMDISSRLINALEDQGLKRKELAERLGVTPTYVTNVLRGHANLSIESLAKFAFALGLKWEPVLLSLESELGLYSVQSIQQKKAERVTTCTAPTIPDTQHFKKEWNFSKFSETSRRTESQDVRTKIPA
ncbi:MAG: helix-turn-helix transcriptional regulator [Pontiellaceae bacterium]|nr:helix-turn-helix transcriptional regulator [Pontiellaceae bacterium]MBN2783640.1 helix-turn-helix transcriptional regulator [Pontiellaceae bacterium]